MVGSTYIYLKRKGRRSLLNTAQVAHIYTNDINLASETGKLEYGNRYPLEQGTVYTIQFMMTCGREIEDIYARADERDEVYNQIVAALAPAVIIESLAPFVPEMPESEAWSKFRKPAFPNEVFATEEEYDRAMAIVVKDVMSGKILPREPESEPPAPPTTSPQANQEYPSYPASRGGTTKKAPY